MLAQRRRMQLHSHRASTAARAAARGAYSASGAHAATAPADRRACQHLHWDTPSIGTRPAAACARSSWCWRHAASSKWRQHQPPPGAWPGHPRLGATPPSSTSRAALHAHPRRSQSYPRHCTTWQGEQMFAAQATNCAAALGLGSAASWLASPHPAVRARSWARWQQHPPPSAYSPAPARPPPAAASTHSFQRQPRRRVAAMRSHERAGVVG